MKKITLNSQYQMPQMGLGTFLLSPKDAEEAVVNALACGYRLIDTANAYLNEKAVGRAIKRSGLPREEIFVETKLWPTVYEQDDAIDKTLERLGVEYIDLLLLHQPAGNYLHVYQMMEKTVKEGKVRSIGLSNFEGSPLQDILDICKITPAVIQVEAHPYYPQDELKKLINKYDIKVQAWYPLGHGDKGLIEEPIFKELAEKYGKTSAQVILRWHIDSGNIVIPGSKYKDHIKENADMFDFALTEKEMKAIAKINKNKRYYEPNPELTSSYASYEIDLDGQE